MIILDSRNVQTNNIIIYIYPYIFTKTEPGDLLCNCVKIRYCLNHLMVTERSLCALFQVRVEKNDVPQESWMSFDIYRMYHIKWILISTNSLTSKRDKVIDCLIILYSLLPRLINSIGHTWSFYHREGIKHSNIPNEY